MDGQVRCPRCWKRGPQTAKFCRRCGCALTGVAAIPRMPRQAPIVPRTGRQGTLLALVVSGAFILLGLLIFGSLARSSGPYINSPATVNDGDTATNQPPPPIVVPDEPVRPPENVQAPVSPIVPSAPSPYPRPDHWDYPWQRHDEVGRHEDHNHR
jgi:hypothetical protein